MSEMSEESFAAGASTAALQERLEAVEDELRQLRGELKLHPTESVAGVLRAVRRLKAASIVPSEAGDSEEEGTTVMPASDPRIALSRLRDFSSKIGTLNGTVASMEAQLRALYADRERLEREIGASEVDDVIAAFRHLQITINSMSEQLTAAYEGFEQMDAELGRSDPSEIIAMFKTVTQLVNTARAELHTNGVPVR